MQKRTPPSTSSATRSTTSIHSLGVIAISLVVLGGCATLDSADDEPVASEAPRERVEPPDPFSVVEEATRLVVRDLEPEPAETQREPHLWARITERFEFAECAADSRARQWAQWYGERDEYMERVLNRARPWLFDIANELERRELPGELALLPIVESAYDPFAYSHGRAAGAWQFVSATARERGVEINDFYDGRRDVWASTRAALDYLSYLHEKFDDWNLALAAYNGGQGRVRRALRQNGNVGSDWRQLRLPRETLGYVPKLNGLACLFAEPARYGFELPEWEPRPQIARIELDGPVDIVVLSARTGIEIAELVALNPGLNSHLTPPSGPHHLFVPYARLEQVRSVLPELEREEMIVWEEITVQPGDTLSHLARRHDTSVRELREANVLDSDFLRAGQKLRLAANGKTPENSPHAERYAELSRLQQRLLPTRKFQHQVRPGENLWLIARRYRVSISDLQRWNGLGDDSLIRPGDRLVIHMDSHSGQKPTRYTVRRGDSLWSIARRHQVTVNDLLRWNELDENSVLRPGQTLTIRTGENA
ncbi:MAG: LysM peptidoglycan-binding domain-containing protein [Wenzhouxiangella sp.]